MYCVIRFAVHTPGPRRRRCLHGRQIVHSLPPYHQRGRLGPHEGPDRRVAASQWHLGHEDLGDGGDQPVRVYDDVTSCQHCPCWSCMICSTPLHGCHVVRGAGQQKGGLHIFCHRPVSVQVCVTVCVCVYTVVCRYISTSSVNNYFAMSFSIRQRQRQPKDAKFCFINLVCKPFSK